MNSSPEYDEYKGPRVNLALTQLEVEKLLDLVGKDGQCRLLVVRLYLCLMAFTTPNELISLEVSKGDVLDIHRVFSMAAFGIGAKDFRIKLGNAIVEIEREEYLNGK